MRYPTRPKAGGGTVTLARCLAVLALGLFCLLAFPAPLPAQVPIHISEGPIPSVRLGEVNTLYTGGTVDLPVYVKGDYLADGLHLTIDYDDLFLGYAWYKAVNSDWRVVKVVPYGGRRMTFVLQRTNHVQPERDEEERVALVAVFYMQESWWDEPPFFHRTPMLLGSDAAPGSTETYFFTQVEREPGFQPMRTARIPGAVTIYYKEGVELGGGSITGTEQDFVLPLYLTYLPESRGGGAAGKPGPRTFTVGIDYDEVFLGLTGVEGVVPPLDPRSPIEIKAKAGGGRQFDITLAADAPEEGVRRLVARLELRFKGFRPPGDQLEITPQLIVNVVDPNRADGPGGGGALPPGAQPGVVSMLPDYFLRGNVDSSVSRSRHSEYLPDQSDVIRILEAIFLGRGGIPCADAADANDSGLIDVSDVILILNHLYLGGAPPASPYPLAGLDPDGLTDGLGCEKPLPMFFPQGGV